MATRMLIPTPGHTFVPGLPTHGLTTMLIRGTTTDITPVHISAIPDFTDRVSVADTEITADSAAKSERRTDARVRRTNFIAFVTLDYRFEAFSESLCGAFFFKTEMSLRPDSGTATLFSITISLAVIFRP